MLNRSVDGVTAVSSIHAVGQSNESYQRSNLTRLQLLYWVGQALRPDAPIFTGALAFTLSGPLDEARFRKAFAAVVAESDALRTIITIGVDGIPQQIVVDQMAVAMPLVDLSHADSPETAAKAWMQARIQQVPLLSQCLFDTVLLRLVDEKHIWFINQHHLITDAGSTYLLFERVARRYETAVSSLPPLFPFADYVAYERAYLHSSLARKSAAFWEEKLAEPLPALRVFGKTPHKQSTAVTRHTLILPPQTSQKIRALASHPTNTAMTADAARYNVLGMIFLALLHRITGLSRLSFLSPVHNRPTQAFKQTIGLLMELCPIVMQIEPDDTFASLLARVNQEVRASMRHYQYGTSLFSQNRIHDIMFNVHERPVLTFNGTAVEQEMIYPGAGTDTLECHVRDEKETNRMFVHLDFHNDVFTPDQQEMVLAAYKRMVDACLADMETAIAQVNLPWDDTAVTQTDQPENKREYLPPRDMLEFQLQQIWEELLGVHPIGVNDNFFELGGSSWQAMRLFVQIENLTGCYLPMTTLLEAGTIARLVPFLRKQTSNEWETLITIQKGNEAKRPLFLIPGAGGNGLVIARIAQYISPDQPVYTFLIPGLVGNEIPYTTIEEMGAFYAEALLNQQTEGPYLLGGYSAGGVVAFETARQLKESGHQVDLCVIIDAPAQSRVYSYLQRLIDRVTARQQLNQQQRQTFFLKWRDRLFAIDYFLRRGWLDAMMDGARMVKRKLTNAISAQTTESPLPYVADQYGSQMEDPRMRAIFELNDRAVRSFIPRKYAGKLILIKSKEGYERHTVRSPYRDLGWGRIAEQGVTVYEVPGTHLNMVREPNVQLVARHLQNCLDEIQ
ncbi:MAG: hypothetical protein Kow0080_00460 [Candidatus Promineifilaceae bacterium]